MYELKIVLTYFVMSDTMIQKGGYMKHITSLNTFRFLAVMFIVLLHAHTYFFKKNTLFSCASLAVELFFVLSGFLLAKTYEKRTIHKQTPLEKCQVYCKNHFLRLWPEYFFAVFITIILLRIFSKVNISPLGLNVIMISGIGGIPGIIGNSWYVSVVFWIGCFLTSLLIFTKDKSKVLIFPFLFFLSLFFLINNKFPFRDPCGVTASLLSKGMIRGFVGMVIGIYTWWICEKIPQFKKRLNSKLIPFVLFIGEVVSVSALFYTLTFQPKHNLSDFNVYFYAAFLIGLLYFQKEKLLKFMSWNIWAPFAKTSCMLYLTHHVVLKIFEEHYSYLFRENILKGYIIILLTSLLFSFICYYIFIWLRSRIKKLVFKT